MNKNVVVVILAGGKGERLWPLSRQLHPKQLLSLNGSSLLAQTIDRVDSLVDKSNLWIFTTDEQKASIQQAVGSRVGVIATEPATRNTGPAVLLACLKIYALNPEALIVFVPADHYIKDTDAFQKTLMQAIQVSEKQDSITLLGIKPTHPATGYGYIQADTEHVDKDAYPVHSFHEKPTLQSAQQYVQQENMLWNSGIFCGKVDTFLREFRMHALTLYQMVHAYVDQGYDYQKISSISFDHAVLEHSNNVWVVPALFDWSDVGNLDTFLTLKKSEQNVIALNAHNNKIDVPGKLVALIGVNNLCVVQTEDALLIAQSDNTEHIKEIVQMLKKNNKEQYL